MRPLPLLLHDPPHPGLRINLASGARRAHAKPQRLFLLHSSDAFESRGPVRRLKRLFDKTDLPKAASGSSAFRATHSTPSSDQLNLGECALNFTGGNKLTAAAAFHWTAKRGL